MNIVIVLVVGLAAGWLASRYLGVSRYGVVGDVTAGVAGAWVGGFLAARLLPAGAAGIDGLALAATLLGACVLIAAARVLTGAERAAMWPR